MQRLREQPLERLGDLRIVSQADYLTGTMHLSDGRMQPMDGPTGNVLILRTELAGNYLAVRPSGTEPKIKFYFFTSLSPEQSSDLVSARKELRLRLDEMQDDVLKSVS